MSVTYNTNLKNARLDAVTAAIDAGAGAGKLEIGTAGMAAVLVTIPLNDPSAPAAAAGVLTLDNTPALSATAAAGGTAAAARIRDSNNVDIVTGLTVGTSAADIILNSVAISAGQTVTINSATITHG